MSDNELPEWAKKWLLAVACVFVSLVVAAAGLLLYLVYLIMVNAYT